MHDGILQDQGERLANLVDAETPPTTSLPALPPLSTEP
jgi:hypothetical protein